MIYTFNQLKNSGTIPRYILLAYEFFNQNLVDTKNGMSNYAHIKGKLLLFAALIEFRLEKCFRMVKYIEL